MASRQLEVGIRHKLRENKPHKGGIRPDLLLPSRRPSVRTATAGRSERPCWCGRARRRESVPVRTATGEPPAATTDMTGGARSPAHSAVLIKSGPGTLQPSAQPPGTGSVAGLL